MGGGGGGLTGDRDCWSVGLPTSSRRVMTSSSEAGVAKTWENAQNWPASVLSCCDQVISSGQYDEETSREMLKLCPPVWSAILAAT